MKRPENDKWLDEALSETIGPEKLGSDFEQWKQKHPEAVEMLTSRVNRQISASKHPLSIRSIIMKNPITKIAAVLAIVIAAGAISVVGVNIGRYYYYMGRDDDGAPIFRSEDFNVTVTLDDDEVTDVEQARRYLEEMKILSDQGKKELLKVEEMMTDGTLELKVHVYRYELSDGRTIDQREGGSEGAYALSEALWEEWRQLKKAGPGEDLGTYEETVEGRVFSFKRERFFLDDGIEVIWSCGTPKVDQ
ncbi:MAG TPA: hypothetical protein VMW72_15285 [Sedimentisphaerales bacterium]|nr:hypothetical protein [Sedimentisphaerales bacterium]